MADKLSNNDRWGKGDATAGECLDRMADETEAIHLWTTDLHATSVEHEQTQVGKSRLLLTLLRGFQESIDRALSVPGVLQPSVCQTSVRPAQSSAMRSESNSGSG